MSAQRTPVYMGLILLISTAGYSKSSAAPTESRAGRSLFQLIMDKVRHAKDQQADGSDKLPHNSNKQPFSGDTKEVHDYKSYPDDHVLEVFPRDLRRKDKFLKHLTGPLYVSPKCSKHFNRLYHGTRDCTVPAYYKRCARLLMRLAGSPRCMEG
ncbi:ALK and LTK ligand 2b [Conger conger]|uniref:ALK and LTK ligand 2b n=1 Tax=Conger conger TaxID=82655 RepID=UPI002A599AB5|nr:ALK and LTK ligand 2b [Conger conger]XP_061074440.1 ALK and LTK ligand 2b [Conger conger]